MSTPYYKNRIKSKINPISNKRYELSMFMYGGSEMHIIKHSLVEGSLVESLALQGESIELIYDKKKIKADNKHLL